MKKILLSALIAFVAMVGLGGCYADVQARPVYGVHYSEPGVTYEVYDYDLYASPYWAYSGPSVYFDFADCWHCHYYHGGWYGHDGHRYVPGHGSHPYHDGGHYGHHR